MNKTYSYTCNDCKHNWTDCRPEKYVQAPIKFGCHKCRNHNISFEEKTPKKINSTKAPNISDPVKLGRMKPDEGFKDILRKIKKENKGSTINID